jgi:hypothetical protein
MVKQTQIVPPVLSPKNYIPWVKSSPKRTRYLEAHSSSINMVQKPGLFKSRPMLLLATEPCMYPIRVCCQPRPLYLLHLCNSPKELVVLYTVDFVIFFRAIHQSE